MTTMRQGRPLTRIDLVAMPDDGHRYELIDGALIVTPAPTWRHREIVGQLFRLLADACQPDLRVFVAPLDVVLSDTTVMQPDVLVTRRADLSSRDLPTTPLLAVEVLSPSTRHIDLMLKHARYEAVGCASYWVVDPVYARLTAWSLRDSHYVVAGVVVGDEEYAAEQPFHVTLRPAGLILD